MQNLLRNFCAALWLMRKWSQPAAGHLLNVIQRPAADTSWSVQVTFTFLHKPKAWASLHGWTVCMLPHFSLYIKNDHRFQYKKSNRKRFTMALWKTGSESSINKAGATVLALFWTGAEGLWESFDGSRWGTYSTDEVENYWMLHPACCVLCSSHWFRNRWHSFRSSR